MSNIMDRLLARRTEANGCWLFDGAKSSNGYGVISLNGRQVSVHRAAYEAAVGKIPDGMQIDHLCRVRSCFNPDHLEVVTPAENKIRANAVRWAKVTACKRGHEFDEENTYYFEQAGGTVYRGCRKCRIEYSRRYRKAGGAPDISDL